MAAASIPGGSGIAKTNRPSTPLGTRTVGGPLSPPIMYSP